MITNTKASLMEVFAHCYELAMRTKVPENEQPGVIGYFPVYFPEEIVHAAGLRPHAIFGGGNKLEVRLADACWVEGQFRDLIARCEQIAGK